MRVGLALPFYLAIGRGGSKHFGVILIFGKLRVKDACDASEFAVFKKEGSS